MKYSFSRIFLKSLLLLISMITGWAYYIFFRQKGTKAHEWFDDYIFNFESPWVNIFSGSFVDLYPDFIYSFSSVLAVICLYELVIWCCNGKMEFKKRYFIVLSIFSLAVIVGREFMQINRPGEYFDWYDIVAYFVGCILAVWISLSLKIQLKKERIVEKNQLQI